MRVLGCFIGSLLSLVYVSVFFPEHSDFKSAVETSRWLNGIEQVQYEIEEKAISQKSLQNAGKDINREIFQINKKKYGSIDVFEITELSMIILRGGSDGQVMMLIPSLVEDRVSWRCIGGSKKAIFKTLPRNCYDGITTMFGPPVERK